MTWEWVTVILGVTAIVGITAILTTFIRTRAHLDFARYSISLANAKDGQKWPELQDEITREMDTPPKGEQIG